MWQRPQTIFLAIGALSLILMILFPVWAASIDVIDNITHQKISTTSYALFPLHYTTKISGITTVVYFPYSLTAMFAVAAATLAIIEIGKFQNRMLQIKMGALNSLLIAATLGSAVYFAIQLIKTNNIQGEYGLSLFMPIVAMVCNAVANRFIRRDEKVVKDSDRLR